MHDLLRSLRIPGFGRLVATYTLNDLAHFLSTIALSILVYDATRDPLATTALFVAAEFLPAFVVPALTARADGLRPARVLGVFYLAEAALLGGLALLASSFVLPVVLVLAFVNGALAVTGRAITRATSVAVLEEAGALRTGNAALNVGFALTSAAGPAVAGALVAALGTGSALAVGAGLFALLAAYIARGRDLPAAAVAGEDEGPWRVRVREGIDHVRGNPTLRTLVLGQGVVFALLTMAVPIQVVYATESLGVGAAGFGLFVAFWGVGMIAGSAVFARERTRSIGHLVVGSTAAIGLGYLGIAAAPTLLAACGAALLGGLGNGVQWVAVITAVQEATEARFQARVAGLFEAVASAAPGAGFLLGGLVASALSPRAAFAVPGAGVLAVLLVGVLVVGRRSRRVLVADGLGEPEPAVG